MILKLFLQHLPLFICFGGSQGSSTSSTLPAWAAQLVKEAVPAGEASLANYQPTGPLYNEAATTLGSEVTGANLNPETNPAVQAVNASTQAQANQQFQTDVGQIQGAANAGGALYSSGVPDAEAEAAQQLATGVGQTVAQTGNQDYLANLGIMANAVPAAQGFNQQQLNDALQTIAAMRGWKGNATSDTLGGQITVQQKIA
jgi:hypothetical protein